MLEGTVTVLFTDVQGSTELRTSRGDDAARLILRAQEDVVRQQVEAHSGREVKALGDGFMVAFGSARRAVQCAVGIQRAIHDYNHEHPVDQVQVRIGLNSGEVSEEDGDLFGAAVNAAARVAAKAKGGEVLVAGVVKQLAGKVPEVDFVDRGRFRLKGFDERWQLFQLTWPDDHAHAAAPVAAAAPDRTPLVARDSERAELFSTLDAALQGQSSVVLIGGEPGVGKTRLATEVLAEADRRGFRTFTGRCYESEGTPPYQPFIEIVEMAAAKLPSDVLRRDLGDAAPEVARLMPELRRRFDDIAEPMDLPPEQERRYLFNSIFEFIGRAAGTQPVCVLLDDIHWADEASLLLFEHIAQRVAGIPLVILGTYRDVELELGRPLARTLDALHRQRLVRRMALKRLDATGVAAMLAALGGAAPPPSLVDVIFEETEGNPFFVEEVYRHLAESGELFDESGGWRAGLAIGEVDVPESIRLVVGRRLERLDDATRQAMASAAVIGRAFSFSLLAGMETGISEDALFEALDQAERAQLLTSTADGRDVAFTFAHELIRQTLLGELSTLKRQRLHQAVADAIERTDADNVEARASEIAFHLVEAGLAADPEKAARYMAIAGERALAATAFNEALRLFETALDVVSAEDRAGRARILAGLGAANRTLGRWDKSRTALSEAIDIYEELGDVEEVAVLSYDMALAFGWAWRWEDSLLAAGRGLTALGDTRSENRVGLLAISGLIVSLAGNYDAGESMTNEALELANEMGSDAVGYALGVRAIHKWGHMQLRDAVELGERALQQGREGGRLWALVDAGTFIAFSHSMLGEVEDVDRILDELDELAPRIGHIQALNLSRRVRYFTHAAGRAEDLRKFGDDDLASCVELEGEWLKDAYAWQGLGDFWMGDLEAAEQHYRMAIEEVNRGQPWVWNAVFTGLLAHVLAYRGKAAEAIELLHAVETELPQPGRPSPLGAWGVLLLSIEAQVVLGQPEEAQKLYPLVVEALDQGAKTIYGRTTFLAAGIAAAAGQDWDAAEGHFREALEYLAEYPRFGDDIDTRRYYADMLRRRDGAGDHEHARSLLKEAIAIADKAGAVKHAEIARGALAAIS
ncbi:MAG TPA: AAA family ATPase [Candidatus Dormibacteraeota bacterium]|nr:AAA family ATPase [Candidatus Dormibacteraeota bacterium]